LLQFVFFIRGEKVMLAQHLAELYGVPARALNQAVKRNVKRFPADFMFQLTKEEFERLKSQTVISSWDGLRRAQAQENQTENGPGTKSLRDKVNRPPPLNSTGARSEELKRIFMSSSDGCPRQN